MINRREVLWLVAGGAASLLASCVTTPAVQPTASGLTKLTPQVPAPTTIPALLATATSAPTSAAAGLPTAAPTLVQPPTPTLAPSVLPTLAPTTLPTSAPAIAPTGGAARTALPGLAEAVDAAMQDGIQRGATPGGVVLVRHRGAQVLLAAYGLSRKYDTPTSLSPDPISATPDTLYDLASLTKLFMTTAAMRLVEQGQLALDEPVAAWLPEFATGGKQDVTLRHLLTHTSGLPDLLRLWELESTPAARLQRVLSTPVLNPPGRVLRYSDLGLIAVGRLLERVVGSSLDRVVADLVTAPLGLDQITYRPAAELKQRIAPTEQEDDPERGLVWGEVDDANAWSLGGVAGHAGLFGTVEQLGKLAELYLQGGSLNAIQLLSGETTSEMTRNLIGKLGWRGLGWELNASYYMGRLASPLTYGHTGFTGTSLVVDPRRALIVVLLTNRVHPTPDGPSINPVRQAVANAAMAAADAA